MRKAAASIMARGSSHSRRHGVCGELGLPSGAGIPSFIPSFIHLCVCPRSPKPTPSPLTPANRWRLARAHLDLLSLGFQDGRKQVSGDANRCPGAGEICAGKKPPPNSVMPVCSPRSGACVRTRKAASGFGGEEGFPRAEGRGREGEGLWARSVDPQPFSGFMAQPGWFSSPEGSPLGMLLDSLFLALEMLFCTAQEGGLVRAPPRPQVQLVNDGGGLRGQGCILHQEEIKECPHQPTPTPQQHASGLRGDQGRIGDFDNTSFCNAVQNDTSKTPSFPAGLL